MRKKYKEEAMEEMTAALFLEEAIKNSSMKKTIQM